MTAPAHDSPSPWPVLDTGVLGFDCFAESDLDVGDLLGLYGHAVNGESFLCWVRMNVLGVMHTKLVVPFEYDDMRLNDAHLQLAQRVAMTRAMSVDSTMRLVDDAVAMRDRLPETGLCLRDGLITGPQFRKIVSWTDLVDGQPYAADIDADIAAMIRRGRRIAFSLDRLRHRVDQLIFRKDVDAVRKRRESAKADRRIFTVPGSDGMATVGAIMSVEDIQLAVAHITTLADTPCPRDPRSVGERRSDAAFALLTQSAFDCHCDNPDGCTAIAGDPRHTPFPAHVDPKVVIHVVVNSSTLHGDDDEPAFIDGYGVVSADHARDLAARPDARDHLVNPGPTGGEPARAAQEGDPYRPTRLLDTYLRIRDGHSVVPGSHHPAWKCDLDHITEYSVTDPALGGQTCPDNMNVKDRRFHNLKTHGDWLDDQQIDDHGRAWPVFYTPEGVEIRGHPGIGLDLFPALADIRFQTPDPCSHPTAPAPDLSGEPQRKRTRLDYKHQRRRAERARNRRHREQRENDDHDPPF